MAPTSPTFHSVKINTKQKRKPRKPFLAVDVWQQTFSSISVRAIKDVYSTKFKVEPYNMKNYSLSHCINALRKLEDPEYIKPEDFKLN